MRHFYASLLMRQQEDGDGRGSGSGGQGKLDFKDFTGITGQPMRDDVLPPDEMRRLLIIAARGHKESVKKEKTKRDGIKALKEEKTSLQDYRQQMSAGANQYKANPKLADKVQFSGASPEVSHIPNDSLTNTNEEAKNEKKNEYRLTHQLRNEPQFNPQFKPPGH